MNQINRNLKENIQEIDLTSLIQLFWKKKVLIILITGSFAFLSVIYALSIENTYTSKALLASDDASEMNIGGMSSLAQLAGVRVQGNSQKSGVAEETIRSRKFIEKLITKYNLSVPLIAAQKWNKTSGEIIINPNLYDSSKDIWLVKEPSSEVLYNKFSQIMSVQKNKVTGFITVSIEFLSPKLAKEWVDLIILEINNEMRLIDLKEAEYAIEYLKQKMVSTKIQDIRSVISSLMQKQLQTVTLAEVREEYIFKIIDPAFFPEQKTAPNRALICITVTVIGFLISLICVLLFNFSFLRKA